MNTARDGEDHGDDHGDDRTADPARDGVGALLAGQISGQINALGGFIRAQRKLAQLSLRELAALTSVSNAYLSQIERGLHQPSLKVLQSIADALHLPAEQLLSQAGWTGARRRPESDPPASTEDVIRADPRLSAEQRTALLGVYRSFVDGAP